MQPREGKLRSVLTGTIAEDAGMHVGRGSLRIDTARHDLAPGVRAFGVDVASDAPGPKCPGGGSGPLRTLFVQHGASLRPVLTSVELTSWRRVRGPACAWSQGADDAVIENTVTTIPVASPATHGFADLALASTVDGRPLPRRRVVLRYDGSSHVATDDRLWPGVITPETAAAR